MFSLAYNLGEKKEDIDKTIKLMKELNPDYAQFSICSPYPATPLYSMALERGIVDHDIWLQFAQNPLMKITSPVWTEEFSREELQKITARAYRKFYFRFSFIFRQLMKINSFKQFKTMASSAMGMLRK